MKKTLCSVVFLLLCACQSTEPQEHHHSIFIFGTLLEITLSDVSTELADETFEQFEKDYHFYHAAWTPWQESDLTRVNSAIRDNKKIIPADNILPLIKHSTMLARQSQNLFNPAIGNLIKLWQFHKHDDPEIRPPEHKQITEYLTNKPNMADLVFDGPYLSSNNPAVQLNFGAFAKGYAIDQSFEKLRRLGIKNAIINAGGDLRVSGTKGRRQWNIGIRHPRDNNIIASIQARDGESIFTSGDYERYYHNEGKRYHHILDPRTGYPTHGTSSVTVIHDNAAIADAAATALIVAGPLRWHEIAKNMGIRYVMLVEEDGTIQMNPAMAHRIKLKDASKSNIVLSQPL